MAGAKQPGATLPPPFVERLTELFGERTPAVLSAMHAPTHVGVRLNPLHADAAALDALPVDLGLQAYGSFFHEEPHEDQHEEQHEEPHQDQHQERRQDQHQHLWLAPHAQRETLTRADAFADGAAWLQNPSSWLPVLALAPEPGEEVLDLAAAPGGKASHMAACMANRGRLAVVEPVRGRFFRLRANLDRLGVHIAAYYSTDGRMVGRKVPDRFDRVLLDAPCSSEARMRADVPASWRHWSPRKVRECARKQVGLLLSAWQALRPGGELVYCTCSFAPEENEAVVDRLLGQVGDDAEVMALPDFSGAELRPGLDHWQTQAFDVRLARAGRVVPDGVHDGMFICHLRKVRSQAPPPPAAEKRSARGRRRR